MSSCMASVPAAFQVGGVCGGHGLCVNSTRTAGLLLCKCDTWYSGASDLFDNRVETLPDGTHLSYSCHSSDVGTYVVWSIWCLFGLIRLKQLVPMCYRFYKRHYNDPKKNEQGILADTALRIVGYDVIATFPFLATGIAKLAGQTIGTDPLVTILVCFSIVLFQIGVAEVARTEFDIFLKGTMNASDARAAAFFRLCLKTVAVAIYFLIAVIPMLVALNVDKSLGPLRNGEDIVIYLRNAGAILYAFSDIITTWMIRQKIKKLMLQSKCSDSAVSKVIKKMDTELKTFIRVLVMVIPLTVLMTITYMLPFQTYTLALLMGLSAMRHSAKSFTDDQEKERTSTFIEISTETSLPEKSGGTPGSSTWKSRKISRGSKSKPNTRHSRNTSENIGQAGSRVSEHAGSGSDTEPASETPQVADLIADQISAPTKEEQKTEPDQASVDQRLSINE